jgi:Xaa-Pro aminopeptidase
MALLVPALLVLPLVGPIGLAAQIPAAEYQERREQLAATMGDGVLLVLGAPEPPHDYLPFYQTPSLRYLTGITEADAALVVVKRGARTTSMLFVQQRDPLTETWSGIRLGTEGAARATGLEAEVTDRLVPVLDSLLAGGGRLFVAGDVTMRDDPAPPLSYEQQWVERLRALHPDVEIRSATSLLTRMRARKSDAELDLIRRAVTITVEAQRSAMRAIEPGMNEFEIQALIEYTFRRYGAERPAFASIVGSGPNATILHYNRDDRFMEAGDVLVMDVGASYGGYAADVTRTVPVSGTFSPEQRAIYQIVRDAQAAAEREAQVGASWQVVSQAAARTLATGLARLGLIESPDATYDCDAEASRQCAQLGLFYFHGLGHGIGLDVHDPEQAMLGGSPIQRGSAFTIEPGLYVRANVLDLLPETSRNRALATRLRPIVQRHVNIGVRIEDDYIVTEQGVEWISRAPREIEEIEALMREPDTGTRPRIAEMVEWYRRLRGGGR